MSKIKRSTTSYEATWDRFTALPATLAQPYNNQYSTCYNARLSMLRKRCLGSATNKIVDRIIELKENIPSTAVGTIVKSTPGRPIPDTAYHSSYEGVSYLGTPFSADDNEEPFRTYCDDKDSIVLEDESGRVELTGDIDIDGLATGVVVAVEGVVGATGIMTVSKVHFPEMGAQESADDSIPDDVTILLVSGLDCGGTDASVSLKREMLIDYVTGHFAADQGSNIARVIIAGGGCTKPIKPDNLSPFGNWASSKKKVNEDTSNVTLPIRELDLFLGELCASGVPVDYIPGLHDPTNANWPQKALHVCLLPNSGSFVNMLSRSPNPYEAKIGGKCFLGSDGLNITDLRRFIAKKIVQKNEDEVDDEGNMIEPSVEMKEMRSLEALECSLKLNHIAPTGPDSLPTFPFKESDPFVIEQTPHVYFAGNCDDFGTKLVEYEGAKTRLICIPSFETTGQAVLMNLKSMECTTVEFGDVQGSSMQEGDEKKMEE